MGEKIKKALKPGQFVYGSGMVFEIDNAARMRPRPDLKPTTKGPWKHQHYKAPKGK